MKLNKSNLLSWVLVASTFVYCFYMNWRNAEKIKEQRKQDELSKFGFKPFILGANVKPILNDKSFIPLYGEWCKELNIYTYVKTHFNSDETFACQKIKSIKLIYVEDKIDGKQPLSMDKRNEACRLGEIEIVCDGIVRSIKDVLKAQFNRPDLIVNDNYSLITWFRSDNVIILRYDKNDYINNKITEITISYYKKTANGLKLSEVIEKHKAK